MQLRQLKQLITRTYHCSKSKVNIAQTITKESVILTRANVRELVKNNIVTFKKIKNTTRHRPKKIKFAKKTMRITIVRRLRALLKTYKSQLTTRVYRQCYNKIKNGIINTKAKLKANVSVI